MSPPAARGQWLQGGLQNGRVRRETGPDPGRVVPGAATADWVVAVGDQLEPRTGCGAVNALDDGSDVALTAVSSFIEPVVSMIKATSMLPATAVTGLPRPEHPPVQ